MFRTSVTSSSSGSATEAENRPAAKHGAAERQPDQQQRERVIARRLETQAGD